MQGRNASRAAATATGFYITFSVFFSRNPGCFFSKPAFPQKPKTLHRRKVPISSQSFEHFSQFFYLIICLKNTKFRKISQKYDSSIKISIDPKPGSENFISGCEKKHWILIILLQYIFPMDCPPPKAQAKPVNPAGILSIWPASRWSGGRFVDLEQHFGGGSSISAADLLAFRPGI